MDVCHRIITRYLFVVVLRDMAEEFTRLPEQDILFTELFL